MSTEAAFQRLVATVDSGRWRQPGSASRTGSWQTVSLSGAAHALGEKGVRLAQKMQVGPCIPVGIQR